jgi:hypothetical protein
MLPHNVTLRAMLHCQPRRPPFSGMEAAPEILPYGVSEAFLYANPTPAQFPRPAPEILAPNYTKPPFCGALVFPNDRNRQILQKLHLLNYLACCEFKVVLSLICLYQVALVHHYN